MHRRYVLQQLCTSGLIAVLPTAPSWARAPFTFLTDQAYRPADASWNLQIPPNSFLSSSWHVGLRSRSIRAALGAANAVLLMESLRDVRAAVHLVRREGEIEFVVATLRGPAQAYV